MWNYFLASFVVVILSQFAHDGHGAEDVSPVISWEGNLDDSDLTQKLAEAKSTGVITDQKAFQHLWSAWGIGGASPAINFQSYFVAVAIAWGDHDFAFEVTRDKDGEANIHATAEAKNKGTNYFYVIAVVPRTGIKTFRGKPLLPGQIAKRLPVHKPRDYDLVDPDGRQQQRIRVQRKPGLNSEQPNAQQSVPKPIPPDQKQTGGKRRD